MSAELLSGISEIGNDASQIEALNALITHINFSAEGFRVSPFVPALAKVIHLCNHNPEIQALAARALAGLIDMEPRAAIIACGEGGLDAVVQLVRASVDGEVSEAALKWCV